MRSPEQLKGWARNVAAEKHLRAQEILQMFMFERLLERLAASPYQKNFILKGGLLISSMVGLEGRTTMGYGYHRARYPYGRRGNRFCPQNHFGS